MSQGEVASSVSLRYYIDVLRRQWWVVVVGGVIGLALAFSYLAVSPRVATVTAAVSVNVISTDPFNASRSASGLIDTAGEAQVAASDVVARRAADTLGGGATAASVREAVEVVGVPDTSILRITASASSEEQAIAMANAVAQEFLEFRSEQAQTRIAATLSQSDERLAELRSELQDIDEVIANAEDGSRQETQAQSDRSLLTLQINAVVSQAASIESIDTTGGTVLNPADRNPVVWTPSRGLVLLTGAFGGLGLGLLGAYLVNALRSRVRSSQDVSQNGGRTVLGELSNRGASLPPSGDDLAEFRAIRERLLATRHLAAKAGLMVVLDETGRGARSVDALNLGFVIAISGVQLEYVVLDQEGWDMSEVLERLRLRPDPDAVESGRRYRSDVAPAFTLFVPSAEEVPVADEPLSAAMREEIHARRGKSLVMMALSETSSEATRLAAYRIADWAVFLVGRGATKTSDLQDASNDVRSMGGQVVGSVLTHRHRSLAWQELHKNEGPVADDDGGALVEAPSGVRRTAEKTGSKP